MPNDILSTDDATFDTSTGNWVATSGAISQVTSPTPHAGGGVLELVGAGPEATLSNAYIDTIPGVALVTATVWARAATSDWRFRFFASYVGVAASPVDTSAWQQVRIIYASGVGTTAPPDLQVSLDDSPGGSGTGTGYVSDVYVEHEGVNPPTGLTATVNPTNVVLNWTAGAAQDVGTDGWDSGLADTRIAPVSDQEKIAVERSLNGGAFTQIALINSGAAVTYTNTLTIAPGDTYTYRVRYAVYSDSSKSYLVGYSDYSNIASTSPTGGGWGVGMVRMGAN